MVSKAFIDSSAWISYFVPTQPDYLAFKKLFYQLASDHTKLSTSNDVLHETITRLRYDQGWDVTKKFISHIQESISAKSVTQYWTNEQIQFGAYTILSKYSDHKLSLTDATSAVLMTKL